MTLDLAGLRAAIASGGPLVRVVVAAAEGSAPREPGAAMLVHPDRFEGTIGGGALEFEALAEARRRLAAGGPDGVLHYPLGPALAQCCGGAATLAYERWDLARLDALPDPETTPIFARPLGGIQEIPLQIRSLQKAARSGKGAEFLYLPGDPPWLAEPLSPALTPLWLWGAGHVGRAVARVFEGLPFAVTWIDDAPARFPDPVPAHVRALPAPQMAAAAALAPPDAAHLVMTYSHAMDLEIVHAVLARGAFARLGVIGSASKAARFRARLAALGHGAEAVARMDCPIGLAGPEGLKGGKAPAEIAVSVAADHLRWRASRGAARRRGEGGE
ncbi:xanthine dehydrogenase accessory protein XdhC [Albimonas sp. CAU 1670]|uniref:xanthine dehydrogenase accessory protein XdhC n=1 Tax=Albimonas sp. CAU 1670 TaxID=3032599 RepID=UPI0023DBFE18|nr:xanthine dehydrogenase accessory protein XdhC [Albimonas sp. CAU 1670]MDF2232754.1 xanthine dehydrogenase accessory protein XdhC [Albimonas sp. CAU 1670]